MTHATAEYSIQIKSPAGILRAVVDQPRRMAYTKEVNAPGLLTFAVRPDHESVQYLDRDAQIEVWRWGENLEPYCDFYAFFRQEDYLIMEDGTELLLAYCPGQMDLLERSIIAYPADTANRSAFSSEQAETIMKTLVTRNATASGTTGDGRIRNVDAWGAFVSVEADGSNGNVLDFNCFGENLLSSLQRLAFIGGGDFNLVKTAAQAWQFRWFTDHLGEDLSGEMIFSLERGNILRGSVKNNTLKEKTVAIVGGQGEGGSRAFQARTGTNYHNTTNSREFFSNGSQFSTSSGLQAYGDALLEQNRAYHDFDFEIRQTEGSRYGEHFNVGDLVTGVYREFTEVKQVYSVSISYEDDGTNSFVERVKAVLQEP